MVNILCIETATEVCSVAVSVNGKLVSIRETVDQNSHSEKLTLFIQEVIKEANLSLNDIHAVAVSMGPGSYTGLRIGVSTAKGFCFGLGVPLIAISTLQSIAFGARENENNCIIVPMIDARRMEVYTALYDSNANLTTKVEAVVIDNDYISSLNPDYSYLLCGNGAPKCAEIFQNISNIKIKNTVCSSAYLTELAFQKYNNEEFEDVAYFEPFYLKDFIAAQSYVKGLR